MIMGQERTDTVKASNCKVGGNLVFSTEQGEDSDGNPETKDVLTPIDASSWFKYIYKSAITEDQAVADGCSLLTSKPTVQ